MKKPVQQKGQTITRFSHRRAKFVFVQQEFAINRGLAFEKAMIYPSLKLLLSGDQSPKVALSIPKLFGIGKSVSQKYFSLVT